MLLVTLLLSLALAAFFTLLPARVLHRRTTRADLYAGAGAAVLVWLWAACVWSKPGLTVDFDGFRLRRCLPCSCSPAGWSQASACGRCCPPNCAPGGGRPAGGSSTGAGTFRRQPQLACHPRLHAHRPAALPDRRRRPHRADRTERREHNTAIHRLGFPDL